MVVVLIGPTGHSGQHVVAAEPDPIYRGRKLSAWIADLKSRDGFVRLRAARSLEKMGFRAKAAIPALIPLLEDESILIRRQARKAMQSIGDLRDEDVPALVDLVIGPKNNLRPIVWNAILKAQRLEVREVRRLVTALKGKQDTGTWHRQKLLELMGTP